MIQLTGHKMNNTLANHTQLQDMARVMALASGAKQVILFGSAARGTATKDSDLDFLLILEDNADGFSAGMAAFEVMPENIPLDIVPMSESTFKNGSNQLARIVAREGEVLYAR
jgi:predicted nucleotidyltransferase